jgi:hypothetical protein
MLSETAPARLRRSVTVIAAGASLSSGAALVAAILLGRPLWLATTFIAGPGMVGLIGLSVVARRQQHDLFVVRLKRGLLGGAAATAAYDLVRWLIEALHLTSTNSFVAIPVFGSGLTGRPTTSTTALVAGWAFHISNGLGFSIAYHFVAAGRPMRWAIGYALVLEAFMIWLYPGWLGLSAGTEFLSVSIAGHVAYGAVLGVSVRRSA